MKTAFSRFIVLIVVSLLFAPGLVQGGTPKLEWLGYNQGIQLAKTEKKPVIIEFFGQNCYYCQKMDDETFTNQEVIDYLAKNFILIKVNGDEEQKLTGHYRVVGYPTFWFFEAGLKPIGPWPGFLPPDQFLGLVKSQMATNTYQVKSDEHPAGDTRSQKDLSAKSDLGTREGDRKTAAGKSINTQVVSKNARPEAKADSEPEPRAKTASLNKSPSGAEAKTKTSSDIKPGVGYEERFNNKTVAVAKAAPEVPAAKVHETKSKVATEVKSTIDSGHKAKPHVETKVASIDTKKTKALTESKPKTQETKSKTASKVGSTPKTKAGDKDKSKKNVVTKAKADKNKTAHAKKGKTSTAKNDKKKSSKKEVAKGDKKTGKKAADQKTKKNSQTVKRLPGPEVKSAEPKKTVKSVPIGAAREKNL